MAKQSMLLREAQPAYRIGYVGSHAMSTHELLQLVIGGPNAGEIATELLDECQTLSEVARKTVGELQQTAGIGEATAARLIAALELGRRFIFIPLELGDTIRTPADIANLLIAQMGHLDHEEFWVMVLNTKNKLVHIDRLYKGNLNTCYIRVSEVFRQAIRMNAAAIMVAHNHPSHDPTPSPEDNRVTEKIVQAGSMLGIDVLDHVIIGGNRYVSLREKGLGGLG
jgi:DNA repair protein RadC